jgi:cytochrome b561
MKLPKRYHPALVVLHWLTLVLMLGAGFLADGEGGGSPIDIHMILGALLLVTLIIRIIMRFTTKLPAWADTNNQFLNKLGELVHIGLYIGAFSILTLGGLMASQRNLLGYILGNGPASSYGGARFISRLHHLGWVAIMGLVVLHVTGAFYHQFILKDNLFDRMLFGKS